MDDFDHIPPTPGAATQLRTELLSTIKRAAAESDITLCQALGVIRIVEHDIIRLLEMEDDRG